MNKTWNIESFFLLMLLNDSVLVILLLSWTLWLTIDWLARKPHEEEKENKIDQRRKEGCSSHFNLSCKRRNNPSFSFSCPAVFSKKIIRKSWPSGDYHPLFEIFTSREMGQGLSTTRKSPSLWNCLQREVNFKSFFPLPFWDMVSWNRRSFRIVTYKPYWTKFIWATTWVLEHQPH